MQNYTRLDLRMDYKKDTGDGVDINNYPPTKSYIQYLEENLIKYRNEERQINDLNNLIADEIHKNQESCDCDECKCEKDEN